MRSALGRFSLSFLGRLAADQFGFGGTSRRGRFLALLGRERAADDRLIMATHDAGALRQFKIVRLDRAWA